MNSIAAECLMFCLTTDNEAEPPDQWQHFADGTLAFRFGDSPRDFSWPPDQVDELAEQWRSQERPVPDALREMLDRHVAFVARIEKEGKLAPPQRVVHDFRTGELTAIWDEQKMVVVVEPDPGQAGAGLNGSEPSQPSPASRTIPKN
jgi:hypothetical protein